MLDLHRTPRRSALTRGRGSSILMRAEAAGMRWWWKRELVVTDQGLEWDVWNNSRQLVKMTLPYDRVAQVALLQGPFLADVRVTGTTAADSLLILGLAKDSAARVKAIVERRAGALAAA